jgi:hypothetical protein
VVFNPDGSQSAFVIPPGVLFVLHDISISRGTVTGAAGLFFVALSQNTANAVITRWSFVGTSTENVERSFIAGIAFSTPFVVSSGSQLGDSVNVMIYGEFRLE